MKKLLNDHSHRRYNILTGEWVLISPKRTDRPWQGEKSIEEHKKKKLHDNNCYLCPGNKRAKGRVNPDYINTFVFENDFPSLDIKEDAVEINEGLFRASSESGICKVICFTPDHSLSLAEMSSASIENVINAWKDEYKELGNLDFIKNVQIFENKGEIMGCSNPHPHGQIWAQSSIPNEIIKKDTHQRNYYMENHSSILNDYIEKEIEAEERVIYLNDDFVILVPFWAIWPFETMIVPRQHMKDISELSKSKSENFADSIKKITSAYDRIFNCPFPYSAGIHQSPTDDNNYEHWHWHMVFYPPLLRSSTIKKFMVGYEFLAMPQRDITPESAADKLRDLIK